MAFQFVICERDVDVNRPINDRFHEFQYHSSFSFSKAFSLGYLAIFGNQTLTQRCVGESF